jgi:hypothetical protein
MRAMIKPDSPEILLRESEGVLPKFIVDRTRFR